MELRGVTLSLLRALGTAAKARDNCGEWTVRRLANELVGTHELLKPDNEWKHADGIPISPEYALTGATRTSLIDLLFDTYMHVPHPELQITYESGVGQAATVFLSFAYGSDYFELLSCLDSFFEENPSFSPESTFFWFDPCVNNQWTASTKSFDWWANTFRTAVNKIGHTVAIFTPWNKPTYLTRAWCLFELSCSKTISVQFAPSQKEKLFEALATNFPSIQKALCDIDFKVCFDIFIFANYEFSYFIVIYI